MTVVQRQVHGYRQGHQLLASSVQLQKADQFVVDRLSDVAGPLRPREQFEPYLSAYPLPSGDRFVLARTWQDFAVPRAGCVRTLSLIISATDWGAAEDLSPFFSLLKSDSPPQDADASSESIFDSPAAPLPPAPEFGRNELLEALFLEESRPVAVFDCPIPELVALRLLTAMWPSMRRRFALSTFSLSPRKVGGRDFDLVFAPKNARAKFADWNGRRVDGRSTQTARHRWTSVIVSRVFEQPYPQLLTAEEIRLVGGAGDDIDNAGAMRIALFWDELLAKLNKTPTAALGLLDIANSGMVRDALAFSSLEPALSNAVRQASIDLPVEEAWDFLAAMARKMQGQALPRGKDAVGDAAEDLAGREPEGAISFLAQPDPRGIGSELLPRIADGIGGALKRAEEALLSARPDVLGRLIAEGRALIEGVAGDALLVNRIGDILPELLPSLVDSISAQLLPYLVEDWQLPAAEPLLMRLDGQSLADEIRHLSVTNDFAASRLTKFVVEQARKIGAIDAVRTSLADLPSSERRDQVLAQTLDASPSDANWLLYESNLPHDTASGLLVTLLREADQRQLSAIIGDARVTVEVMRTLESNAPDLLQRAFFADGVSIDIFVRIAEMMLPTADVDNALEIAELALHRCLVSHFAGDEVSFIATILGIVGGGLDGALVARIGLGHGIQKTVASRNMIAFWKAPQLARLKIVRSIAQVAEALSERRSFDLNAEAAEAFANIMLEAEKTTPSDLTNAAGHLLPMLMRQHTDPVSQIITAAFPVVYHELAKEDDVPDLLKFVPFVDWDRCKTARQELVSAFMSSNWPPADLALTACRCADIDKILRRTAKSYGGEAYIERIAADIKRLPDTCRKAVEKVISEIKSRRYSKYDW